MKKKKTVKCSILVLAILLGAFLTACSTSAENKSNALKIAIVCSSAGQNDNGYNQSAVNGAKRVSEELGVEYKIIEPTTGIPNALETLAEDGYDLIFNLEYDFEALIRGTGGAKPIAEQYPDTTFIVMNNDPNRIFDVVASQCFGCIFYHFQPIGVSNLHQLFHICQVSEYMNNHNRFDRPAGLPIL